MEKTPGSMRRHVALLGNTNAGKSTLFNALTGQDASIVSDIPGTTTDPVQKAMELIPFGPIVLTDTAGMGDESLLGSERARKTRIARRRADAALYAADATCFDRSAYESFRREGLDHILVFTKCDIAGADALTALQKNYPDAEFHSPDSDITTLLGRLSALLEQQSPEEPPLIGDLVPTGGTVVLVTPIDSAAPKGRLILPQVQALRDCLDHGIKAMVCRETELESALASLNRIDLVVTDSQAFAYVDARVPRETPLTSFSMLLARQGGGFSQLLAGADAISRLPDGARLLMLEGCSHNRTHEDIGRVKIPALLKKRTGKSFLFDYYSGYDFPDDLSPYSLAIQCGGCMINTREKSARLAALDNAGVPVTNYGVFLAWANGILERCSSQLTIIQKGRV